MLYLILSIIANAGIYLLFKFYQPWNVNVLNVIVVNYTVASIMGFLLVNDYSAIDASQHGLKWIIPAAMLGLVFIGIFVLMANSAQHIGVGITTVASKMSLALSVVLLVVFSDSETLTVAGVAALILALASVVLVSLRKEKHHFTLRYFILPLVIFAGSAVIDFGIAQLSVYPDNDSEVSFFSTLSFAGAAVAGYCLLALRFMAGKFRLSRADVVAGVVLGLVNYGTIFFLVSAYDSGLMNRSAMLPVNNLAVVLVNAFASAIFFREKISGINWLGVFLAVISIIIIMVQAM